MQVTRVRQQTGAIGQQASGAGFFERERIVLNGGGMRA